MSKRVSCGDMPHLATLKRLTGAYIEQVCRIGVRPHSCVALRSVPAQHLFDALVWCDEQGIDLARHIRDELKRRDGRGVLYGF